MSWSYHVAGDAAVAIRRLDVEAQEAVFDALEDLLTEVEDVDDGEFNHLVYFQTDGGITAISMSLFASSGSRVLILLDVG